MRRIPMFQSFAYFNTMDDKFLRKGKSYLAFSAKERFYGTFLVFYQLKTIPFDDLVTLSSILDNWLRHYSRFELFSLEGRDRIYLNFLSLCGIMHNQ